MIHKTVMLKEVIEYLDPKQGQMFVDGTANGGGHTFALAEKVVPDGKVIAIEWDKDIFDNLKNKVEGSEFKNNISVANDNYANLKDIISQNGVNNIDGMVLDLGFSSLHLESSGRGFSFQKDEPLDMRYSQGQELTAYGIVNGWSEEDIARILRDYGEERFSYKIAKTIHDQRKREKISTTNDLVKVIERAVPAFYRRGKIHCATRTFQALRIAVNGELDNVERVLPQIVEALKSGGRVAIISFHSLEDRIVKNFFKDDAKEGKLKIITKKPIVASDEEMKENPRSRSAKLRVAEKI